MKKEFWHYMEMAQEKKVPYINYLNEILRKFEDTTTKWSEATDELPEMYMFALELKSLKSQSLSKSGNPSEWNKKHKNLIINLFEKMNNNQRIEFIIKFAETYPTLLSLEAKLDFLLQINKSFFDNNFIEEIKDDGKELFNSWYAQIGNGKEMLGKPSTRAWNNISKNKNALGIWKIKVRQAKNTKTMG
jgi:hypothetical protein